MLYEFVQGYGFAGSGTRRASRQHTAGSHVTGVPSIIPRWLAVQAVAAFFGVVLTAPAPATAELMPPVTLFVFLFAVVALGIAEGAGAVVRSHASGSPLRVDFVSPPYAAVRRRLSSLRPTVRTPGWRRPRANH